MTDIDHMIAVMQAAKEGDPGALRVTDEVAEKFTLEFD